MRRRSGFGWLELVIGILLIILGVFTLVNPGFALSGLVALFGIIAIVMGVADIVLYVRVERFTGFGPIVSLISGILSVMSGIMLLVYPNAGRWVLSLLFPIWFIAHCISRLSQLNSIRFHAGNGMYYFTLIVNIIGLVLGILMVLRPLVSMLSIGYIVGFYLILLGVDSIALAASNIGSRR
ncbi:MAG TPA: DUF308 domain-containing protein [Candidatus Gemmiger faecigallinarum]|nr:DUF308 domain-containing protein [Candidatus Gemmiger faecigallinarum]